MSIKQLIRERPAATCPLCASSDVAYNMGGSVCLVCAHMWHDGKEDRSKWASFIAGMTVSDSIFFINGSVSLQDTHDERDRQRMVFIGVESLRSRSILMNRLMNCPEFRDDLGSVADGLVESIWTPFPATPGTIIPIKKEGIIVGLDGEIRESTQEMSLDSSRYYKSIQDLVFFCKESGFTWNMNNSAKVILDIEIIKLTRADEDVVLAECSEYGAIPFAIRFKRENGYFFPEDGPILPVSEEFLSITDSILHQPVLWSAMPCPWEPEYTVWWAHLFVEKNMTVTEYCRSNMEGTVLEVVSAARVAGESNFFGGDPVDFHVKKRIIPSLGKTHAELKEDSNQRLAKAFDKQKGGIIIDCNIAAGSNTWSALQGVMFNRKVWDEDTVSSLDFRKNKPPKNKRNAQKKG